MTEIEEIKARNAVLKSEWETNVSAKAKDLSDFLVPYRGRYPGNDNKPDRSHNLRGDKIIDSTPGDSLRVGTNGMYSGLTPPSRPWHRTVFEQPDLNKWGPSKQFMDLLSTRRASELRKSNFYSAMWNSYEESMAFANTCIALRELEQGGFVFSTLTFGEFWWARNDIGKVDTLYRPRWMYAKNMIDSFGEDKVSLQVKQSIKNNRPYDCYEVLHAVEPRVNRDTTKKTAKNKPFKSIWLDMSSDGKILRESGFDDFPYACAVWLLVGSDNYGTGSPGLCKLPDIKMLQDMEESSIMAAHREIDPPMLVPSGMKGMPAVKRSAGGMTYYDGQPEGIKRLFEFKFDLQAGEMKAEAIRQRIRRGFYNDLFMMITGAEQSGQPPTATQIMEMQGEKMLQLGPFIERQEDELLDPIIAFVTSRMLARPYVYGLPMPPEEIMGSSYKIEYISLLAQAQKMIGIRAIDDMATYIMTVGQAKPEVIDNWDWDESVRERADIIGSPAKLVVPEDKVQQLRDVRQQALAEQQAAQEAMTAVEGASKLGQIKTGPEDQNAATDLMGGMMGQQ